jgi:hypothetical protein
MCLSCCDGHKNVVTTLAPAKIGLAQMGDVMQKIINEVKEGGIQLIDHATSLLCAVASNV